MKVFTLIEYTEDDDGDYAYIIGIYSTQEKAYAAYREHPQESHDSYAIWDYVVDSPGEGAKVWDSKDTETPHAVCPHCECKTAVLALNCPNCDEYVPDHH